MVMAWIESLSSYMAEYVCSGNAWKPDWAIELLAVDPSITTAPANQNDRGYFYIVNVHTFTHGIVSQREPFHVPENNPAPHRRRNRCIVDELCFCRNGSYDFSTGRSVVLSGRGSNSDRFQLRFGFHVLLHNRAWHLPEWRKTYFAAPECYQRGSQFFRYGYDKPG